MSDLGKASSFGWLGGMASGWFTHWDSPELDGDTHGFNFMAQLYGVMRQMAYGYCRARILKEK